MKTLCYILGLVLICVVVSCGKNDTVDNQLAKTYAEYVVLRMSSSDTAATARSLDSLLKASGYSTESFFEELHQYGSSPERMRVFFDSARTHIERLQSSADSSR